MFFLGWQGVYTFVALCVFVCLIIVFFAELLDEDQKIRREKVQT